VFLTSYYPLGKPRHRWEDNIRMDLKEMGKDVDWINLAQDRDHWQVLVITVMNLRDPSMAGNFVVTN
jgi:hypothetical protein